MNTLKNLFTLSFLLLICNVAFSQTDLNGGEISGTFNKASSPYLVKGDLEVPLGKTLTLEAGVEVLFTGQFRIRVYGSIQALGTESDSVIFASQQKGIGWFGFMIFKNKEGSTDNVFAYTRFSGLHKIERDWRKKENYGVFYLDTVTNIQFDHCLFENNVSFMAGCIRAVYSSVIISNSSFSRNYALDTLKTPESNPNTKGTHSSCIMSLNSIISINNCNFLKNISSTPNYAKESYLSQIGGRGMIFHGGGKLEVINCVFEENEIDVGGVIEFTRSLGEFKDSFIFVNNLMKSNSVKYGSILRLDGSNNDYSRVVIKNCLFEKNVDPTHSYNTSTIACYNAGGGKNDLIFEQCTLKNNETYFGLGMAESSWVYFNDGLIIGQHGPGILTDRTNSRIVNTIIANNWGGILGVFNSNLNVVNSLIAYNGRIDTTSPFPDYNGTNGAQHFSYGVNLSDRSNVNFYSTIITGNKGHLGQMANIIATSRSFFPGNMFNTILEGGTDSTYRQSFDDIWVPMDTVPFLEVRNLHTILPTFIRPASGVGVEFASLSNDFHHMQSCQSTPGYNQGMNIILKSGLSWIMWNGRDFDGNSRIVGGTMDIGPYELKGEKGRNELFEPWGDTTLCSNNLVPFNPSISAYNPSYNWEYSANGTSWSTLDPTKFTNNQLKDAQEGHYRIIVHQQECNVTDTFGPAKLSLLEAPQPRLGNDTTIGRDSSIILSPGTFPKYVWNVQGGDTSHVTIDAKGFSGSESKLVWTEVTASNGCKARDSILIRFGETGSILGWNENIPVLIYPNPAYTILNIRLPNKATERVDFQIIDSKGSVIISKLHIAPIQNEVSVNVEELTSGLYVLRLITHSGMTSRSFLVQ